jgi:hypothetical protein
VERGAQAYKSMLLIPDYARLRLHLKYTVLNYKENIWEMNMNEMVEWGHAMFLHSLSGWPVRNLTEMYWVKLPEIQAAKYIQKLPTSHSEWVQTLWPFVPVCRFHVCCIHILNLAGFQSSTLGKSHLKTGMPTNLKMDWIFESLYIGLLCYNNMTVLL